MDPGDPGNLRQAVERAKGQGKVEEAYRKILMDLETNQSAGPGRSQETRSLVGSPGRYLETLAIPGDETVERFETEMQDL